MDETAHLTSPKNKKASFSSPDLSNRALDSRLTRAHFNLLCKNWNEKM